MRHMLQEADEEEDEKEQEVCAACGGHAQVQWLRFRCVGPSKHGFYVCDTAACRKKFEVHIENRLKECRSVGTKNMQKRLDFNAHGGGYACPGYGNQCAYAQLPGPEAQLFPNEDFESQVMEERSWHRCEILSSLRNGRLGMLRISTNLLSTLIFMELKLGEN